MQEVTGNDSTHKIAARMNDGTSAATVNRWKKGRPGADKVITLCRVYDHDPVVGLLYAGYISEEELKRPHVSALSTAELLAELEARTQPKKKEA